LLTSSWSNGQRSIEAGQFFKTHQWIIGIARRLRNKDTIGGVVRLDEVHAADILHDLGPGIYLDVQLIFQLIHGQWGVTLVHALLHTRWMVYRVERSDVFRDVKNANATYSIINVHFHLEGDPGYGLLLQSNRLQNARLRVEENALVS
jgi:hypothetical protein